MKAILVIDMPKCCDECPLAEEDCAGMKKLVEEFIWETTDIEDGRIKPNWCPLKPMPKKKNEEIVIKGHTGEIAEAYQDGWNACLEELLK